VQEILKVQQCYAADRLAEGAGIESYALMKRAGAALAKVVMACSRAGKIQILCGPGANGGDGYVAAKVLHESGRDVRVFSFGDVADLNGDAARAHLDWHGAVSPANPEAIKDGGIIINALFGAGLARPLEDAAATLVQRVNTCGAWVISADLPSGVFGDQGTLPDVHVHADETVTFFRQKLAHVLQPSRHRCGKIHVSDIGIPNSVLDSINPQVFENGPALWPGVPPTPSVMAHKHARGHVLVRTGNAHSTGAARLAARAALRTGAGLVTLAAGEKAADVCAAHETEVMVSVCASANDFSELAKANRASAVVIGPAGGVGAALRADVAAARALGLPMVLDADGLSSCADAPDDLFALLGEACVLTPHEGEFGRLFPDLADRETSKIDRVQQAAKRAGCVVLLKGPDTVIAAPDGRTIINTNAPPWLATAGSGDVLAGIIGALLAGGAPGFDAAACGAWLHGHAGGVCGRGLIAGDLITVLPQALVRISNLADQGLV